MNSGNKYSNANSCSSESESFVSEEAMAMVNALLHPSPEERPEAAAALEHPWVALEPLNRTYARRMS
jgi:hypothetical protein